MNTYTGPVQNTCRDSMPKMKTVQFGIAVHVADHNVLKENYGI